MGCLRLTLSTPFAYLDTLFFICYPTIRMEIVFVEIVGLAAVCLFIGFIALGRMYLGIHSLIDIFRGLLAGLIILTFWLKIHDSLDNFIVSWQNANLGSIPFLYELLYQSNPPIF